MISDDPITMMSVEMPAVKYPYMQRQIPNARSEKMSARYIPMDSHSET